MAAPTLTTMMSNVRLLIQDTNTTTAPAFTDAQITTFINRALRWWYENIEKRVKYVTLVADWDAGVDVQDGDATCLYPEILEFSLVDSNGYDLPLDYLPWSEIRMRQSTDPTETTPTHYSKLKYGGAAVSASAQNKWKFALYPVPSASNNVLKGVVRDFPVALSAGADIVDLGDFEGDCVETVAAILAAPRSSRPELAEDLWRLLPQLVKDKLETHMKRDEVNA